MSDDEPDLDTAAKNARAARERLTSTLADIQTRLNPRTLARDAIQDLRETSGELARDGMDAARRHPFRLAVIVAGIGALAARGPILRRFGRRATRTGKKS